jgi:hypothetical protein
MAPAWPDCVVSKAWTPSGVAGIDTVVGKVETAIYPDALLRDIDVLLRICGPLALGGDPLSLLFD